MVVILVAILWSSINLVKTSLWWSCCWSWDPLEVRTCASKRFGPGLMLPLLQAWSQNPWQLKSPRDKCYILPDLCSSRSQNAFAKRVCDSCKWFLFAFPVCDSRLRLQIMLSRLLLETALAYLKRVRDSFSRFSFAFLVCESRSRFKSWPWKLV